MAGQIDNNSIITPGTIPDNHDPGYMKKYHLWIIGVTVMVLSTGCATTLEQARDDLHQGDVYIGEAEKAKLKGEYPEAMAKQMEGLKKYDDGNEGMKGN